MLYLEYYVAGLYETAAIRRMSYTKVYPKRAKMKEISFLKKYHDYDNNKSVTQISINSYKGYFSTELNNIYIDKT